MNIKQTLYKLLSGNKTNKQLKQYYFRFNKYSYVDCKCESPEQFKASITRLYHTIEKGLAYKDYRAGFGKENIEKLLRSLEQYAEKGYDCSTDFYETALACLESYIIKNSEYGYEDKELANRISKLPGSSNGLGGTMEVFKPIEPEAMSFEKLITSRHSIRHFSEKPVEIDQLIDAIKIAQFTPSACNRQGWKARIIVEKDTITDILANQNGNKGFGHEIDKLIIITADLRSQQRSRELFQAYIDGGMFAANILNALYYKGIGSIPLSAAFTPEQEMTIRAKVKIDEAEVFILIIGVGNYPEGKFLTTKSNRRKEIIEIF